MSRSDHCLARVAVAETPVADLAAAEADLVIGRRLADGLGLALRVRRAAEPAPAGALSAGERRQWRARPAGPRRHDWLVGRAALKSLLGPPADTSGLAFPHPRLSLTHAGGMAWALAVEAAGTAPAMLGAGIDHEPWREVDPRMARFFLHDREALTGLGLLAAWTVKEALYKAVPVNHDVTLLDVVLDDPEAATGAARGPRGERLRYCVVSTDEGPLAAAVCLEAERVSV